MQIITTLNHSWEVSMIFSNPKQQKKPSTGFTVAENAFPGPRLNSEMIS
jgi:hypothetical protein